MMLTVDGLSQPEGSESAPIASVPEANTSHSTARVDSKLLFARPHVFIAARANQVLVVLFMLHDFSATNF
ncbi:MAG: hypothetical protein NT154_32065 [Verrucomicrobia bacterium]|nr:hypothetical protein [Verrucomicrobiota bacterium]